MSCFVERAPESADDQATHQRRVAEAHFGLGGVNIDVHLLGGKLEKQRHHRMPVPGEQIGIGASHGACQQAIPHRAVVDEQILVIGNAAAERRQPCDPAQPQPLAHQIDPDAILRQVAVGERGHPRRRAVARCHRQHRAALMLKAEADFRPRHCEALHGIQARGIFRTHRA
jgi:hypothetical protein